MVIQNIFISSMVLSLFIILFVSYKWQIELKKMIIGSLFIGSLTVSVVYIVHHIYTLSYLAALLLEGMVVIFCITVIVQLMFHRDPDRISPQQDNIIVSPADGKVRYIKCVANSQIPVSIKKRRQFLLKELTKTNLIYHDVFLVGIEMNILDVHVNRAPVKGKIIFQQYHPGRFLSLRNTAALFENERVTTLFDNGLFQIGVIQIASRLVRRIVSFLKIDQTVDMGERFGVIKFGSQVDLVIPSIKGLNIKVKEGEKMKAGVSVIAEYDEKVFRLPENPVKENYRIFLLAYPDNPVGKIFLETFMESHISLSGIIVERKNIQNNWDRYRKKVHKDGFIVSAKRMMQVYGMKCLKQSIENIANKYCIPLYEVDRFNSRECENLLSSLDVDLLVIASAPILKEYIFKKAKIGCLNAHPGFLPKYRGIGANAYAVKNGDSPGVTVHFIDKDIDKGKIIVREKITIEPKDTIQKINDRAVKKGADLMANVIHMIQKNKLIIPDIDEPHGHMYHAMPFSEVKKINKRLRKERTESNAI